MPTIDQLAPAIVAADSDTLFVNQGGKSRRVTRAQLLAGTQAQLSVRTGLLGRSSPGTGAPEQIGLGGGLQLSNGVLSCPAPFSVSQLEKTDTFGVLDAVPISVGGEDRAVPLGELLSTPGVDVSEHRVTGSSGFSRSLQDWIGDELSVEAFGAIGDGSVDDSAAFAKAVASGRPIRLGAKVYRVDGQWTISSSAALIGVPGFSVIRRGAQIGGAWIRIQGPSFSSFGITFDAGASSIESWSVLVASACVTTDFERCSFVNSAGGSFANGLTIEARDGIDGSGSRHIVRDCLFENNTNHGLWIQAANGASVIGCVARDNGKYGLCIDYNDSNFLQVARNCLVSGCQSINNERGISVGNFNETNAEPPRWGLLNPDVRDTLIVGNVCSGNSAYGIAASGAGLQITNNQISSGLPTSAGSGILLNASRSLVIGNSITGPGGFGIDAGGSDSCDIADNFIYSYSIGVNAGGSRDLRVSGNRLRGNTRALTIFNVETNGDGENFGISCTGLSVCRNLFELQDTQSSGISLFDGPQNTRIHDNEFASSILGLDVQCMILNTDTASICGNRWNGALARTVGADERPSSGQLTVPDVFDEVALSTRGPDVCGMTGAYQASMVGRISFVRVTSGGTGYSRATIEIVGGGSGATGSAHLRDGVLIGVALLSHGSGFDEQSTKIIVTGDGAGAMAEACIGVPIQAGRRLRVTCGSDTTFSYANSAPRQNSFLSSDIIVPGGTFIEWQEAFGSWQAASFQSLNSIRFGPDNDVRVCSDLGTVTLESSSAQVRVTANDKPDGFITGFGRGSPEGVVAAPPGSDYRNLDGGAGHTLWIKMSGTNETGWVALA